MDRSTPADSPHLSTRIKYKTGISKPMQKILMGIAVLGVGFLVYRKFKK